MKDKVIFYCYPKVPGMQDFSWSPKENILAYWVAEDKVIQIILLLKFAWLLEL